MKHRLILAALVLAPTMVAHAADEGKIVFGSTRTGNSEIFVVGPDGTNPVNVTNTPSVAEGIPMWSPDGTQIAYQRTDDIWFMNADGSGQTRIVVGHIPMQAAFKPNSNLISYSRFGGFDHDVYTIQPDGTNETRIVNNPLGDYYPRWSPDGTKLSFHTFTGQSYQANVFLANPNGTGQVQLTNAAGHSSNASWSPDGGRLVFQANRDGNSEIYVMNADGSGQTRLTNNAAEDTVPVFSPDGQKIAFVSNRDGNNEIYIMNANGTMPVRLTNDPGDDNNPSWQQTLPAGAPDVSIGDVTVAEGNSGTANAVLPLTLSAASSTEITVTYQTYSGTAVAGQDFTATGPVTVTFAPGETTKSIAIPVAGDTMAEDTENFSVRISAIGANIARQQGVVTIADSDPLPFLVPSGVTFAEGNSGITTFNIPLALTSPAARAITVQYATADDTAVAGSDYIAKSSTVTIPAGETSATIQVSVIGDTILEAREIFLVKLSNPVNARLARSEATVRIGNDDKYPGLSIADASVAEGGTAAFVLTLSTPVTTPVTVNYATSNGSATAGSDYTAVSGVATIPAGQTSVIVDVETLDDTVVEANENFSMTLSKATNAVLTDAVGQGTITIDVDDMPDIYAGDVSIREGDSGERALYFSVWLSEPAPFNVSVNATTADGTAKAGADYTTVTSNLLFSPGQVSKGFIVPIIGEKTFEANETFFLKLSDASNGVITTPQAKATLINDDVQPTISISDLTIVEGNSKKMVTFAVTLSAASSQTVTVRCATANGSAMAGSDYAARSGTVVFSAGETSEIITIQINGDTVPESDETFMVNLSSPTNATIADGQGVATLTNDDASALRSARQN